MADPRPPIRAPTPRMRGFTLPAEWERHDATWLAWPHDEVTWPGCLDRAEEAIATMAAAVGRGETVHLLVGDRETEERAGWCLNAAGAKRVSMLRIETADAWIRDYGPIVVAHGRGPNRQRLALDFQFNAWGRKYKSLLVDDGIPKRLKRIHRLPTEGTRFVLEGGSIDSNGQGTLLTTEQCLLHENRNKGLSKEEIERQLREWLGVRHILWLGEGIAGDDTDGHVDDITRFVGPTTVVTAVEADKRDPNHAPLADNLRRLRSMADQDGHPLSVVELPMPTPVRSKSDGRRLPASYMNFYIANRVVCVPTFGGPKDALVLRTMRRLFPQREVVPVRCDRLVEGMGALHCMSMQHPK